MKATFLIPLALFLCWCCGCDQGPAGLEKVPGKERDSVMYFFERSAADTLSVKERLFHIDKALVGMEIHDDTFQLQLLSRKIYLHNLLKQYDSSRYYTDRLIRFSELQSDTLYLAKAYYRKSRIFRYSDNPEESFKAAMESKKFFLALGDSSEVGKRLVEMAIAQERQGDYSGSQESAAESLLYLDREKDRRFLSSSYNCIAIGYRKQKLYNQAIHEYENALKFAFSTKDSLIVLNNITNVIRDKEEFATAIKMLEAIIDKVPPKDTDIKARIMDNLAYTRWLHTSDPNTLKALEEALEIRQENGDMEGLQASYAHLSDFYSTVNSALAIEYGTKLLDISTRYKNPEGRIKALEKLVHLERPPRNQRYAAEYIRLNDSLVSARLRVKNAFAKIKYDYTREEQQKLKYKAEKEKAELLLDKQKNKNLVLLLLILGVAVISYLWYALQRTRQQARIMKERQEAIYHTETRLSKKVHDELANGVYNVMAQLGEDPANRDILDQLERIYTLTRNISRENTGVDTGGEFPDELASMLGSYPPGNTRIVILGLESMPWKKVSAEKKIVLYRVLQELMTNMKKHSKATWVAITFGMNLKTLRVTYSDNGRGIPSGKLKFGNGLRNTENRILFVKGSITFDIEKGFRAEIQLPC